MGNKRRLITLICLLLGFGFAATSLINYYVSRGSIRQAIVSAELPLTSDNIYSEIQKDLVRPIFVSSMMARDTFMRDWVLTGEQDVERMTRYLDEIRAHYGMVTSFFISDHSGVYYHAMGVLKRVRESEPRDAWYYRVREMKEPYEINVDADMANRDALTFFVNYKVFDYEDQFLGATGVGLTVETVHQLINQYQLRYSRGITFVDASGRIMLSTRGGPPAGAQLKDVEGLAGLAEQILRERNGSYQYHRGGSDYLLNVRFLPELKWFLLVEKPEDEALAGIRRVLFVNLGMCAGVTGLVLLAVSLTLNRFQGRLEEMATTDKLTGLANRQAFDILLDQALKSARRDGNPLSLVLLDIDYFKEINDRFGHLAGDEVIRRVAGAIGQSLRHSDLLCRWGGDEFLAALPGCSLEQALVLTEKIRARLQEIGEVEAGPLRGVGVSAGVATLHTGDTADSILGRADTALYEAKSDGRNRVRGA